MFASPNALAIHIGRTHGKPKSKEPKTAASSAKSGDTFPCSDCDLVFDSVQKRGAHRRHNHPNPLTVVPPATSPSGLADVPFEKRPFDPQTVREQQAAMIR